MKKILHSKIPNDLEITYDQVNNWHRNIKNNLGDEYILITSPYDLNCVDGDIKLIKIDAKEYSYYELMDVIEKASMYDGLCK